MIIYIILINIIFAQVHFIVEIPETGNNEILIIENIIGLEPGDEIGVFDSEGLITPNGDPSCDSIEDELLVGSGIYNGEQLEIVGIGSLDYCSIPDGYKLSGWVEDHPISIRVWDASEDVEYIPEVNYSSGGYWGQIFHIIDNLEIVCDIDIDQDNICDYIDDCVGAYDDCGVCNGGNADQDCNGVCFGDLELDDCGVCGGAGYLICWDDSEVCDLAECPTEQIYISYNTDIDIAEFQFDVEGVTVMDVNGGAAEENGFTVFNDSTTVIGFSFTNSTIPAGTNILTILEIAGNVDDVCLDNLIISDSIGEVLEASVVDCTTIFIDMIETCDNPNACNFGDEDDCNYPEENYDCDGNCILELDCNDVCGGNAVIDECGVCDGVGFSMCWNGSEVCDLENCPDVPSNQVNILYNTDADIAGFQFDVTGVTILDASGGMAEENGFEIYYSTQANNVNRVLGFSLTGSTISANTTGTLIMLEIENNADNACLSNIIIAGVNGIELENIIIDCTTIVIQSTILGCTDLAACNYEPNANTDDGTCEYAIENYDCDGNCIVELDCNDVCGGNAELDECGMCDGDNTSCADPGWSENFDPSVYEFSAALTAAEVYIDGQLKITGQLAAFAGDEIRGLDSNGSSFFPPAGTNVWEVSLYSNQVSGEIISFKYYDDINDVVIDLNETIEFYSNDIIADAYSPFIFTGTAPEAILGCTDDTACNYSSEANQDDGSCDYAEENFDCDGNCIAELDCNDVCGGSAEEDVCGVCNGPGLNEDGCCGDEILDCNDVCGGTAVVDECGVCDGGNDCLGLEQLQYNFILNQAYPNPFNPSTTISYDVAFTTNLQINIYNVNGQLIYQLINKLHQPGRYSMLWDARNNKNGIYFVKLITKDFTDTKKIILIK